MSIVEVKTEEEKEIFFDILSKGWAENNWVHLPAKGEDFLLKNKRGVYYATLTILKFNPQKQSFINDIFRFDLIEPIKSNPEKTVEIDNFTILKKNRGGIKTIMEGFKDILTLIFEKEDIEYCIGIVKPNFFKAIKLVFKDCVKELTEEPIYSDRDKCYFIPFYIDVKEIERVLTKFRLLKKESTYS